MRKITSKLLILMALGLFAITLAFQIYLPADAQAKPLVGFTPTPTIPDGGGGGGGGGGGDTDDNNPPGFIIIQIESCDLTCSVAETDSPATDAAAFLAVIPAPELLAPVRLIHQGSGFIVEGTLSNQRSTRFSVPYPGQWQVVLLAPPQAATGESLNLAPLEPSAELGLVEANVLTPQFVKCPLNCAVDPPPAIPETLPVTGEDRSEPVSLALYFLMSGLSLAIVGVTWLLVSYHPKDRVDRLAAADFHAQKSNPDATG